MKRQPPDSFSLSLRRRRIHRQGWLNSLAWGLLSTSLTILPVQAAEKLYLIYNPLIFSLKVSSLEAFAKEGTIDKNLEFYLNLTHASQEQQAKFREALLKRADLNPVQLYRFFNTEIGEDILSRIGEFITIQGGRNGKYALRAALIQAAQSPEGLTLLNFLEKLPTNMELQGEKLLEGAKIVEIVLKATKEFTEDTARLAEAEAAANSPVDYAQLPDVRQLGPYGVQEKQTWQLNDESRKRSFYVDVYRPQQWRTGQTPVVIISHGLASRPEDFAQRAKHLASYGYVVALPQHPGSDYQQAQALLTGYSREVFDVNEFINRPRDISFVIDELERRNQSEFEGRLNLEAVGVKGHSFGGYTALAVAGAEIDWENLQKECERQFGYLNTSLLLQCRALNLSHRSANFRDPRVKAVVAVNPVNSSIFGPQGLSKIQIPVLIGAGTYDPAAPAIFEQIRAFPWLKTQHKYLAIAEGQAHIDFSQLDAQAQEMIDSVEQLTLPSPDLLNSYGSGLILPFFEVYIANNPDYRLYLQAAYTAYLSQGQEFKIYLISEASSDKLEEMLQQFKEKHGLR